MANYSFKAPDGSKVSFESDKSGAELEADAKRAYDMWKAESSYEPPADMTPSMVGAIGSGFLSGIPGVGDAVNRWYNDPIVAGGGWLSNRILGTNYPDTLEEARQQRAMSVQENPISATVAGAGGAMLPIPAMQAGRLGSVLQKPIEWAARGSTGARVAKTGAVGAGYGGAEAGIRETVNQLDPLADQPFDPGRIAESTAVGAAAGGALGTAIPAVGAGVRRMFTPSDGPATRTTTPVTDIGTQPRVDDPTVRADVAADFVNATNPLVRTADIDSMVPKDPAARQEFLYPSGVEAIPPAFSGNQPWMMNTFENILKADPTGNPAVKAEVMKELGSSIDRVKLSPLYNDYIEKIGKEGISGTKIESRLDTKATLTDNLNKARADLIAMENAKRGESPDKFYRKNNKYDTASDVLGGTTAAVKGGASGYGKGSKWDAKADKDADWSGPAVGTASGAATGASLGWKFGGAKGAGIGGAIGAVGGFGVGLWQRLLGKKSAALNKYETSQERWSDKIIKQREKVSEAQAKLAPYANENPEQAARAIKLFEGLGNMESVMKAISDGRYQPSVHRDFLSDVDLSPSPVGPLRSLARSGGELTRSRAGSEYNRQRMDTALAMLNPDPQSQNYLLTRTLEAGGTIPNYRSLYGLASILGMQTAANERQRLQGAR